MSHELSKNEKKVARILIDKGVDAEFKKALEQVDKILSDWKKGNLDHTAAYHKMFKKIEERNKAIANRYDDLRGSDYLITLASLYVEGQITEEDIKGFSENTKAVLNNWLRVSRE